MKKSTNTG